MNTYSDVRKNIKEICEKTLNCELSFKDFHNAWPSETKKNIFYQKVFRDAEDVMEHLPEGPEQKDLEMYWALYLDIKLLDMNLPENKLLEIKNKIEKSLKRLTKELIDKALKDYHTITGRC